MIRGSELALAKLRLGALARLIGVTPTGERYIPTWFSTEKVCHALDLLIAHAKGKSYGIRRVRVQQPTQTGKSFHTEELFPAALAGHLPEVRTVISGYGTEFMSRTLPNIRALAASEGYQAAFPHVRFGRINAKVRSSDNLQRLDINAWRGGKWKRTGGFILARSIRGAVTGNPMDAGILGDPYKDWKDALSAAENRQRRDFYTGVFKKRQQSRRSIMVLASTPWTPTDLNSFVIDQWEKEGEPYLDLKFPMFQRPDSRAELLRWRESPAARAGLARFLGVDAEALDQVVTEHGLRPYDPRVEGYPLLPYKDRDVEFYEQIRRSEPLRDFLAMCQLDPDASAFERFPRAAWREFSPRSFKLGRLLMSIDTNAIETEAGSFAVCGVYSIEDVQIDARGKLIDPDPLLKPISYYETKEGLSVVSADVPALPFKLYRLDEPYRERPGYGELFALTVKALDKWPEVRWIVLERKAAGQSLLGDERFTSLCAARGIEIIAPSPHEDKEERAGKAKPVVTNGYCFIPAEDHGRITAGWRHDDPARDKDDEGLGWLREMADRCAYDDRVDEFSQVVTVLRESPRRFQTWDFLSGFG